VSVPLLLIEVRDVVRDVMSLLHVHTSFSNLPNGKLLGRKMKKSSATKNETAHKTQDLL
jgi:hypothetical protein